MIVSASRRTDIPAFYAEWFVRRLREGFVLVRNPLHPRQVSRIALSPEGVECLVFWTKNPAAMLDRIAEIDRLGYRSYFLFTLTPYDSGIEPNVPAQAERLAIFRTLAGRVGRERVIWRYDPILFASRYPPDFHRRAFARLAGELAGYTERCIVSFVQMYRKCERNMRGLDLVHPPAAQRIELLQDIRRLGAARGIAVQSCAAGPEFAEAGIAPGRCIDGELISRLIGARIVAGKDRNQRKECGCIESIDIGAYNCCPHHCLYCYANSDRATVAANLAAHLPDSPLLYGGLGEDDRLAERPLKPLRRRQLDLF